MKTSLYTIETEYQQMLQIIEEADGEVTPEMEESLAINEKQLQSKSIAYVEYIGSREAVNDRIDAEVKRLNQMKKVNNNLIDRLKSNLLDAVKIFGDYEVGLTKFGTRKSSSVQVDDVNSLPSEYKTIKVTEAANKAEIKAALKRGESITGCEIVENLNLKIN